MTDLPIDTVQAAHAALLSAVSRDSRNLELFGHLARVTRHLEALERERDANYQRLPLRVDGDHIAVRGKRVYLGRMKRAAAMTCQALNEAGCEYRKHAYPNDRAARNAHTRFVDWLENQADEPELARQVHRALRFTVDGWARVVR